MRPAAKPRIAGQTGAASAAVEAQGLGRRFGSRVALAGVSFRVAPGECLALLGPNGSGKSTLLRVLATLIRPSEGTAAVGGHDVAAHPDAVRRQLGCAFQTPSLDGKLTVRENLRFQGWLYGLYGAALAARMDELLGGFGLRERAGERAETLSGGLKRRVELAKTLLHRPGVLLLDEPSTGLDPAARIEFWDLLETWQRTHTLTVIVATHLLDEAERCGRVALLDQGRLLALESPQALTARLGGPAVTVECDAPERLAQRIRERLGLAATAAEGRVRLPAGAGLEAAARVLDAFPGEARAVRLGRPSLEDAFIALTGHPIGPQDGAP
jgi:ABC-2 type transport system ATP-binding protein